MQHYKHFQAITKSTMSEDETKLKRRQVIQPEASIKVAQATTAIARAGQGRATRQAKQDVAALVEEITSDLTRSVLIVSDSTGRKTVRTEDVLYAAGRSGTSLLGEGCLGVE